MYSMFFQVCLATANYPGIPYQTNFFLNGTPLPDQVDKSAIDSQNINKSANHKSKPPNLVILRFNRPYSIFFWSLRSAILQV